MVSHRISIFLLLPASLIFLLGLTTCKKDNSTNAVNIEDFRAIHEAAQVLQDMDNYVLSYSNQGYMAPDALMAALGDILNNNRVDTAWHIDSAYVLILGNAGLEVTYSIVETDASGEPLTRGGSDMAEQQLYSWSSAGGECSNEIENKNVLLFNAEFYTTSAAKSVLNQASQEHDIKVTELRGTQCDLDAVTSFSEYGLVVINSHGKPNGFQIGTDVPSQLRQPSPALEAFAEKLHSNQEKRINDLLKSNLLRLSLKRKYKGVAPILVNSGSDADDLRYYLSGKYIASLAGLDKTIIFGNMCYSGYQSSEYIEITDIPVASAFLAANTLAYYGYQSLAGKSYSVESYSAEVFEEKLFKGFFQDGDSTGNAHLRSDGTEYHDSLVKTHIERKRGKLFFRQFGNDTYCYGGCGDTLKDTIHSWTFSGNNYSANDSLSAYGVRNGNSIEIFGINTVGKRSVVSLQASNYNGQTGTFNIGGPNTNWVGSVIHGTGSTQVILNSTVPAVPVNSGSITITEYCDSYIIGNYRFQVSSTTSSATQTVSGGSFRVAFR